MRSPKINSILLIDDDEISNLFNKIFIGKLDLDIEVDFTLNGIEGLAYLKKRIGDNSPAMPNLILLDIRMPLMSGWQFLDAYDDLLDETTKSQIVIVMLTTSEDEGDMIKAIDNPLIKEVIKKPLSENKFNTLIEKFFVKEKTS